MSPNERNIYLFVKGHKGRYAYVICCKTFEILHECLVKNVLDDKGNELWMINCDIKAMLDGIDFIANSREKNGVPKEPIVNVITSFEENYELALGRSKPRAKYTIELCERIKEYKEYFKTQDCDNPEHYLKFYFLPKSFVNQMNHLSELLNNPESGRALHPK